MENKAISLPNQYFKSNSSIRSLSILVVDDDTTCLSIVAALLKSWKYQVETVKHPHDALKVLKIKGNSFDLVISDVHMPDINGFELQKKIEQEYNLPVVFMSADDQEGVIIKGLQSGASFFIVKPVTRNDLKNLWQYAFANKKGKAIIEEIETIYPCKENTIALEKKSPIVIDISNEAKERKMKTPMKEEIRNVNALPKKTKFVWTSSLHDQFLEAIRSLGLDKAVPKKILEIMNVKGLTREHVASHLQKYRLFMKKLFEASSKIHFEQLQSASGPELPFDFLLNKHPVGGYIPISKYPKLEVSSSSNHMTPFISNSTLGSGNLMSILYNKKNPKQPMLETSKSIYDKNNFVYGNKTNSQFYGNFSNGVFIGQEKPEVAQNITNSGLYMEKPIFEKFGAFNNSNFNLDPKFKRLDKLGTFENKGLEGSSNFVFENELVDGMVNKNMNTVPVMGGTWGDDLAKLRPSSSNNENQSIFEMIPKYPNSDNFGINRLDDLSNSRNNFLLQQPDGRIDDSITWPNHTNVESQTQIQQSVGDDQELIPKFGIAGASSMDQNFESFDHNFFEIDPEEFMRPLISPREDDEDRHGGTFEFRD